MSYTTPQDVRDRWLGDGTPPADAVLQVLIDDAEDTILAAIPDIDQRISSGAVPLERMKKIVSRMVIRYAKNPEGYRQIQETTGPFTRGYTHGGDEPGSVYLTPSDKRELLGVSASRAFQIDTTPPLHRRPYDAEV